MAMSEKPSLWRARLRQRPRPEHRLVFRCYQPLTSAERHDPIADSAIYPLLQSEFSLTFMQIGMIPSPSSSPLRYCNRWSATGPIISDAVVVANWHVLYLKWSGVLALAGSFGAVLLAAALVGTVHRSFIRNLLAWPVWLLAGVWPGAIYLSGRRQLWQFPGALLAAVIIAPYGKGNVAWFVLRHCWRSWCWRKSAVGTRHSTNE